MSDILKGGQGRSASQVEADGCVMAFSLAIAVCLVVLLVVNAIYGGGK